MSSHHEQITAFAKKMEKLDYDIDRLQHRLANIDGEVAETLANVVNELQLKRDGMEARLSRLESAAEESVKGVLQGVEIAWNIVAASIEDATENFLSEI